MRLRATHARPGIRGRSLRVEPEPSRIARPQLVAYVRRDRRFEDKHVEDDPK
jgi:hypothetical protein